MRFISKHKTQHRTLWLALVCAASAACDPNASESVASDGGDAAAAPSDDASSDGATSDATLDRDTGARAPDANVNEVALLDHMQWRTYDAQLDPLRSHQPAMIDCTPPAWFIERGMLEINTGACNYLLLEHPSLVAIPAGTEVLVEIYHYDLIAPEPAQAHLALLFGDQQQWEDFYEIPQPGNVHQISFRSTRALAQGEPIRFHIHNHGQNTWLLASVHALVKP